MTITVRNRGATLTQIRGSRGWHRFTAMDVVVQSSWLRGDPTETKIKTSNKQKSITVVRP